jgi:hypothetical protein
LAAAVYTLWGWNAVAAVGGCLTGVAFLFYLGELEALSHDDGLE